jgi:hypothetical protein
MKKLLSAVFKIKYAKQSFASLHWGKFDLETCEMPTFCITSGRTSFQSFLRRKIVAKANVTRNNDVWDVFPGCYTFSPPSACL